MNDETPSFTIKLKEKPVLIDDQPFTLKELTGSQRDIYLNENAGRLRIDPTTGQTKGFKDYKGIHTDLLSKCMYDPEGKVVTKVFLNELPASVVTGLFQLANELNKLDEDPDSEGND